MNKSIIFLSRKENYWKSAEKIKNHTNLKVDIIYIEDFMKNRNKNGILEDSIIYFLCNSILIKKIVNISNTTNSYVFNKKFFEKNYTKLEIQKILINNKIAVPKLFSCNNFKELKYPVFCKENKHAGIIFKAYTSNTIERFFERFDKKDFYIEESINGQQEEKYYYVKGNVYCKNNFNTPAIIIDYCDKISKLLNIEIFSIDIIKKDNSYIVIDVNPSAGFYLLDKARNNLIYEIEKLKG